MSSTTQQVVSMAWNFAHLLRDDGLSYMAYVEQITFLLFLKMADEQTRPPYNCKPIVPRGHDWPSLLAKEGDDLEVHYRHLLGHLGVQKGMRLLSGNWCNCTVVALWRVATGLRSKRSAFLVLLCPYSLSSFFNFVNDGNKTSPARCGAASECCVGIACPTR
jgi:HsdM N-terminal domain